MYVMYVHVCTCMYMYACMYVCMFVCMYECMYVYVCIYTQSADSPVSTFEVSSVQLRVV